MARLICAWCKKVLKENIKTAQDSHGICKKCEEKLMKELKEIK